VCTNLFIPSRFWTTDAKFDTLYQPYIATCRKKIIYRCTSTVSALNYSSRFFFPKPSAIHMTWFEQTCPPISLTFAIFDRKFMKIVAPPTNKYAH